jgi:hypothetical protein
MKLRNQTYAPKWEQEEWGKKETYAYLSFTKRLQQNITACNLAGK